MSLSKYLTAGVLALSISENLYAQQSQAALKDDEVARVIYSGEFKRKPPTTVRYFDTTQTSRQSIKSLGPELGQVVNEIIVGNIQKYKPSFSEQIGISSGTVPTVSTIPHTFRLNAKGPEKLKPYFSPTPESCSKIESIGPEISEHIKQIIFGVNPSPFECTTVNFPPSSRFSEEEKN